MISTNFILSSVVDSVKGKVSFCLVSVWKKRYTFLWRKNDGNGDTEMAGLGTIINMAAIILGGLIGLLGGKLKVANMLPAIVVAVVCAFIPGLS